MKKIIEFPKKNYIKITGGVEGTYKKINKFLQQKDIKIAGGVKEIYKEISKFLKQNFIICLFGVAFVLSAIIFVFVFWKFSINCIPIYFIGALLLMSYCSETHVHTLTKPLEFLNPLFLALGTSFTLICFIIHLHGDVFISYDTIGNQPDKYKWFEVKEILDFPIRQLESSENPLPQNIDFLTIKDKNPKPLYHIIIIDKTGSVKNSYPHVNNYLKKEISKAFNVKAADQKNFNGRQTSDLIPAYIAAKLFENLEKDKTNNDNISFVCFSGINNDFTFLDTVNCAANDRKKSYTENIKAIKEDKKDFILKYFAELKKYDAEQQGTKGKQITSFKQIFTSLSSHLKKNSFADNTNIHVTIISDFINTDSTEAVPDFDLIRKIKLLNLYILKGFDPQNPIRSPYTLIEKATKRYSCLKEIKTIDFQEYEKGDTDTFYKTLAILNFKYFDHKTDSNIFVYSPYEDFHTQNGVKARLTFKNSHTVADSIYFKIGNLDHPNDLYQFYYYKNSDSLNYVVVNRNDLASVLVNPSDTLNLRMPTAISYKSDRLFVELSNKRINKTESRMISILPLLSKTTSYFLLILYTVFVIAISLILILTNYFVFRLIRDKKVKCPVLWHSIAIAFPIGLGVAILLYYYVIVVFINNCIGWPIPLIILFTLFAFTYFRLRQHLKDFNKKANKFAFQIYLLRWLTIKWVKTLKWLKRRREPNQPHANVPPLINIEGIYKIKSVFNNTYINTETDLPTSTAIKNDWWSAQWEIIRIAETNNFYIENKWKRTRYSETFLGTHEYNIVLFANKVAASIWTMTPAGDNDIVWIQNARGGYYLCIVNNNLVLSYNEQDLNSEWLLERP